MLGKEEDDADKLRSILAQLEYTYDVKQWVSKGVPFDTNLYVPEIHPVTEVGFCEREDEGHILKVRLISIDNTLNIIFNNGYTGFTKCNVHVYNLRQIQQTCVRVLYVPGVYHITCAYFHSELGTVYGWEGQRTCSWNVWWRPWKIRAQG